MRPSDAGLYTPPAPKVFPGEVSALDAAIQGAGSNLAIWSQDAFEQTIQQRRMLGADLVLVNDPEGVRRVMQTNGQNYRRPDAVLRVGRPLGGDGLFFSDGDVWRRQRRLLSPKFTPASIEILLPHFHEAGVHLMREVSGRASVNLSQAFQDTALEAVLRALFSMPEHAARAQFSDMARAYVAGPGRPNLFDFFANGPDAFAFSMRSRRRFQRRWFGAIDAIVEGRRREPARGGARDLLDLLLGLRDAETGETLALEEVRDQCATMVFAGSETTARLMFWASFLFSQDAGEQTRVRAEIAAFPPERVTALEDLRHWPRLRNLLFEAMRLYPPLPHTLRNAVAADEICGEAIPAGAQVWMSAWIMHRHRRFWEHPTAFMPDRFAGSSAPWVQMPAYLPFGAGPRICLGLNFAMAEAQIVLAHLLSRYRVSLPKGRPVLPIGRITIEPSYEPKFRLEAG